MASLTAFVTARLVMDAPVMASISAVRRRLILHKRDALFRRSLLKLIRKGSLFRVRAETRCFAVLQNDNAGDLPVGADAGHNLHRTAVALRLRLENVADRFVIRFADVIAVRFFKAVRVAQNDFSRLLRFQCGLLGNFILRQQVCARQKRRDDKANDKQNERRF